MRSWRNSAAIAGMLLFSLLSDALAGASDDDHFSIGNPQTTADSSDNFSVGQLPKENIEDHMEDKLVFLSQIEGDIAWARYGITSLQQGLIVNSIKVNRGNCEIDDAMTQDESQFQFPFLLNYGNSLTIHMMCQPIEIVVYTNLGYQQFNKR